MRGPGPKWRAKYAPTAPELSSAPMLAPAKAR
jgi:hypothetical protein